MSEDKRVKKTRNAIREVFFELTKSKKLNEITIKELCENADINKSTFYLHYRDIFDLADSIQKSLLKDVCAIIDEYSYDVIINKAPELWKRIADAHFKNPNDLGMFLRRPGMQAMVREFERGLIDKIMNKFVAAGMKKDSTDYFQHHLNVTFIISGYVGVLQEFDVAEMETAMLEVSKRLGTGFVVEIDNE